MAGGRVLSLGHSHSMVPDFGDVSDPKVRARYGYLEAKVSILGNAALFVLKLALGLFLNSIALIADAFHTLSDMGTSAVVILGFRAAQKPPDEKHPHGHGRMEHISTIVIAVLLALTGLTFVEESAMRLMDPGGLLNSQYAVIIGVVVIATAVGKELMAVFSFRLARHIDSDMLHGDAWHHRSDAFASVAVGLGIIGSAMGHPWLDPVFGIVVSVIIIWVGVDLFRRSSDFLLGRAPDDEMKGRIEEIARNTRGVRGVHRVSLHDYGTTRVISLHAEVRGDISMDRAHRVADLMEGRIRESTGCASIIHLDPMVPDEGDDGGVSGDAINRIVRRHPDVLDVHKLQVVNREEGADVRMHVVVHRGMSVQESHRLTHRLEGRIRKECGEGCDVDVHVEPCDSTCDMCGG